MAIKTKMKRTVMQHVINLATILAIVLTVAGVVIAAIHFVPKLLIAVEVALE